MMFKQMANWLIIIIISELIFCIFLSTLAVDERYSVCHMVYGTASRPYVYRMLLPFTVRLFTPFVPMPLVKLALTVPPLSFGVHLLESGYEREWLLMMVGMYASFMAYIVTFRRLMTVSGFRSWAINGLTPLMMVGLTAFIYNAKFYDFSSIFLFTFGLTLLANDSPPLSPPMGGIMGGIQKRDRLYLAMFVLGCLNKETIILLSLIAFHKRRSLRHLGLQLVIFGLIRGALMLLYQDNHGGIVEHHFNEYVAAFLAYPIGMTLPICLVIGLVIFKWSGKPALLKATFMIGFPILSLLSLFWGYPFEYRVFMEVYPAMFLLMAGSIFRKEMLYEIHRIRN